MSAASSAGRAGIDLLRRLAARKFDAGTAERLAGLLARIDDPERLAEAGDWIIECASGDELIGRFGDGKRDD